MEAIKAGGASAKGGPAVAKKAHPGGSQKRSGSHAADEDLKNWGELIRDHPTVEADIHAVRQVLIEFATSKFQCVFRTAIVEREEARSEWESEQGPRADATLAGFATPSPWEPPIVDIRVVTIERVLSTCRADEVALHPDSLQVLRDHLNGLLGQGVAWLLLAYPWLLRDRPQSLTERELISALGSAICKRDWIPPEPQRLLAWCRAYIVDVSLRGEMNEPVVTSVLPRERHNAGIVSQGLLLVVSGHPTEAQLEAAYKKGKAALLGQRVVAGAKRRQGKPRDLKLDLDRYCMSIEWRADNGTHGKPATIDAFLHEVSGAGRDSAGLWSEGKHESNKKALERATRSFGRRKVVAFNPSLEAPDQKDRPEWIYIPEAG